MNVTESSGPCRRRRIAHAGRSSRARPGAVAEQSRRRRGGPGQFEAGDHGGRLAPRAPRGAHHHHHRYGERDRQRGSTTGTSSVAASSTAATGRRTTMDDYPCALSPYRRCHVVWSYYGPITPLPPPAHRRLVSSSPPATDQTIQAPGAAPEMDRARPAPKRWLARQSQSLNFQDSELPGRQRLHPPLLPAIRRPVAETRGFLDLRARPRARTIRRRDCRVASLIISTNSGLSATARSRETPRLRASLVCSQQLNESLRGKHRG